MYLFHSLFLYQFNFSQLYELAKAECSFPVPNCTSIDVCLNVVFFCLSFMFLTFFAIDMFVLTFFCVYLLCSSHFCYFYVYFNDVKAISSLSQFYITLFSLLYFLLTPYSVFSFPLWLHKGNLITELVRFSNVENVSDCWILNVIWLPDLNVQYSIGLLFKYLTLFSYGKSVTYMNDGTSLKSVRQIRRTDIPGV